MEEILISLEKVSKKFGDKEILKDVSLTVRQGKVILFCNLSYRM